MHFIIADDHPLSLLGTQVLLEGMGHVVFGKSQQRKKCLESN